MSLRVGLSLDGLTWNDLYAFTDLARAARITGASPVEVLRDETLDYPVPEELVVRIDRVAAQAHVIVEEDARDFRLALEEVVEEDGDARSVMPILEGLHQALSSPED